MDKVTKVDKEEGNGWGSKAGFSQNKTGRTEESLQLKMADADVVKGVQEVKGGQNCASKWRNMWAQNLGRSEWWQAQSTVHADRQWNHQKIGGALQKAGLLSQCKVLTGEDCW